MLALVGLLLGPLVPTASAQNPVKGLDDRVFPEPMMATTFIQYPDFVAGIETLNEAYPQYMDVRVIGESIAGRPIYFVELTNEDSEKTRDEKLQIGYSASIHANEAAGREGMTRVIEDLVTGTGPLGDMQPYLDDLILNVWFPNPDSWASGDYFATDPDEIQKRHECDRGIVPLFGGPNVGYCLNSYDRHNLAGVDLNREFPNPGWISPNHSPMSEPESQSVVKELRYSGRHENLVTGTDLHGMIDSPNMMRAIIPNQDMDFHRMTVTMRFLKDLEDRVNNNPHFSEWSTVAEALCLTPEDIAAKQAREAEEGTESAGHDHGHDHAGEELSPELEALVAKIDDGDTVWSMEEAKAFADAGGCQRTVETGVWGEVGHGNPFLWGARWDQIGYTDSGFTSDYLMLSPRSPTGGMGAMGTITEFAYSHQVPDNKYVAKLTDMHVAGVRETVRAQMEYTLLEEWPRLVGTGQTAYVHIEDRVKSDDDPNAYEASHGKDFDLADPETHFEFNQVPYNVSNLDFWSDLAMYADDPIEPLDAATLDADALAGYDNLVLTNQTIKHVDAALVKDWVEAGGNLILTDEALRWFDLAGLTDGAALKSEEYLGHSDLVDMDHPLLAGVDWNARGLGEGPPLGFKIPNEEDPEGEPAIQYPQWRLAADKVESLDLAVAGTTRGDPSVGTAKVGAGTVHFVGAALPTPTQRNDHRYGLAPYALTALTYTVFQNALGGSVEWQDKGEPYVPFYPADPLYGATAADKNADVDESDVPAPGLALVVATLGMLAVALRRRR